MNKKQTIVAWVMILSFAVVIARTISDLPVDVFRSVMQFYYRFAFILIVGGLAIFALRNRKA